MVDGRKGPQPPPTIVLFGQRANFHRAALEYRVPLVPQRWLAVTHNQPPVAPEWRGQGRGPGCALAPLRPPPGVSCLSRQPSAPVSSELHAAPLGSSKGRGPLPIFPW